MYIRHNYHCSYVFKFTTFCSEVQLRLLNPRGIVYIDIRYFIALKVVHIYGFRPKCMGLVLRGLVLLPGKKDTRGLEIIQLHHTAND